MLFCTVMVVHSSPDSQPNFCLLSSVQLGKGGAVKHKFSLYFYLPLYENSIYEYFFAFKSYLHKKWLRILLKKSKKNPLFSCFSLLCKTLNTKITLNHFYNAKEFTEKIDQTLLKSNFQCLD